MYVCICNNVTDHEIRDAVYDGARSLDELSARLSVGTCCGKCKSCAKRVMHEAKSEIACTSMAAGLPATMAGPAAA